MATNHKCLILFMIVLNLLIFIAGGALLIAAFMLKFSSGFLELEVTALFNRVTVNSVPIGVVADANAYMMMVAGAFIMFVAVLGLCGAWNHIKGCLWAYVTITIILIMLQAVIVALWIFMRETIDEWFKGKMMTLMENYEGPEATDDVSKGWNRLFIKAECCGVNNQYENGGSNNDFEDIPAAWWANRAGDFIPGSCCQGVSRDTVSEYVGNALCAATDPPINFYKTGCYHRITRTVDTYSLLALIVIGVMFFLQVTAIVCSCILAKKNKVGISPRHEGFDKSKAFPFRPKQIRY